MTLFATPPSGKRCLVFCGDSCDCELKEERFLYMPQAFQEPPTLTFNALREANRSRELSWHNVEGKLIPPWSPERLITAMMGELGEACNCLKKTWREEEGLAGNKEDIAAIKEKMRREFGDVQVYLDLVCKSLDIDLGVATRDVFNAKSEELGFSERI